MAKKRGSIAVASNTSLATELGVESRTLNGAMGTPAGDLARAAEVVKVCDQEFWMLIYDIPTAFNHECPNPSWLLWRYGFRLNLSCWVLPQSSKDSSTINDLVEHWRGQSPKLVKVKRRMKWQRVKTYLIPYAEKARAEIMAIAREKLSEEIVRANESLVDSMYNAEAAYKEALKAQEERCAKYNRKITASDVDGLEYTRILNSQQALRTAKEALDSCMECVCLFEMSECQDVSKLVQALRQSVAANEATIKALRQD